MRSGVDMDHTSFAVHEALDVATWLRRHFGAVPVAGEALPEFRYLLLYVGTADDGARIELLEPLGEGFLARFLATHGEGPHHLTLTVSDLPKTVAQVRALGFTVTGESYDHASWREAFILPDHIHGTVIQLAQSDLTYPQPEELLNSRTRDLASLPSVRGASDPLWWTSLWKTRPASQARFGATYLGSSDLRLSRQLFEGVLAAKVSESGEVLRFSWHSGSIHVHHSTRPGITGMSVTDGPPSGVRLGSVLLAAPSASRSAVTGSEGSLYGFQY